ncbi:hypothetical protein BKA04_000619 [Cryobacterium mesophilum]|uniref:DUF2017 domain-containing protein n=1 Tax=Terrimesophilobacter mesophilus TaxID=433647 RepID=A0A4R8VB19_9MICO|nr:DUF2017 domain-containing protein [Terrimesophilobacter mesophilus]MBB5632396.1 hypothetical protein [Terrimesophilobacter mesophilus]TFB79232.1 DUF2017 domain-containing protein [Terrimesophilobacter mesophilus]
MKPFERAGDGGVSAGIERDEALLLQNLASQLTALLREGDGMDPAIVRLLPDAYPEDPAASAEFRRFTAGGLVERKIANADTLMVTLSDSIETGVLRLDPQQAGAWLRSLTDIRLTLASRLGIESDDQAPSSDAILQDLYDWLGFLQNSLVEAVDVSNG